MNRFWKLVPWALGALITAVFVDSLRFKFTGHPTPRHIFTTLQDWSGIDLFYPAGPWIIGLAELLSSLLVLILPAILVLMGLKRTAHGLQWLGALIALGVMSGAIVFHLFTPLGIDTPTAWNGDQIVAEGPFLFAMACVTWASALAILIWRRDAIPAWVPVVGKRGFADA